MRKQEVIVDGVKLMVLSRDLEVRPDGLPAKEYNLIDGKYKIAIPEEVMVAAEELVTKKQLRNVQVSELVIEHLGVTYDAHERAQLRISTRLASITDDEDVKWKATNEEWVIMKGAELRAILKKASDATTDIWEMNTNVQEQAL